MDMEMIYYEIKKTFSKTGNKAALLAIGILLGITCWIAVSGMYYVNEKGDSEYGPAAVRKLREAKQEWEGELTTGQLEKVIGENRRIAATPEYQSKDVRESDIAYGWRQGISDIRDLLNCAFCDFREFDYYRIDTLAVSDAASFYPNRIRNLQKWLDTEAEDIFSEKEKEYLISRYKELQEPLIYSYAGGFDRLFEFAPTVIMILVLILSFILAGLFSEEFRQKADAVFFSARYGRNRAVRAKIVTGILVTTIIYAGTMLMYSAAVLGVLGADGADCQIQARMAGWKSFYNITNRQEYWLIVVGGYIGTLFMMLLTMLVSAKFRSTVLAVTVPFVLIFLPSFLSGIQHPAMAKVIALLPDQLLQFNMVIRYFNLYSIGEWIVGGAQILPVLYLGLALLLCPAIYLVYRRSASYS